MTQDPGNLYIRSVKLKNKPSGYLRDLQMIQALWELKELEFVSPVTFLVGDNGIGKSTLLEAIAVNLGFNPEGGSRNYTFSTEDTHSELYKDIIVTKGYRRFEDGFFLRAESFYNLARYAEEDSGIMSNLGGNLHEMSHGESFLSAIENRFWGNGVYLLDEPEAALSPMRLLRLMSVIKRLSEEGSQFIISTHSPILMAFPHADIIEINSLGFRTVSLRETEHYKITKKILDDPEGALEYYLKYDSEDTRASNDDYVEGFLECIDAIENMSNYLDD